MEEEEKMKEGRRLQGVIRDISKEKGGINEEKFWEVRRKIVGRNEEGITAMLNSEGKKVESKEEILEVYEEFYKVLFGKKKANTEEEKDTEKNIEEKLQKILKKGKEQQPLKIEKIDIEKAVKNLKMKKAKDENGWQNEMIKAGGEVMVKSLQKMFNKIMTEGKIPKQWNKMGIKSVYKGKGSRSEVKNRRGIFLTNNISKVFEKVLMEKTRESVEGSRWQCGGRSGRLTRDNWMI